MRGPAALTAQAVRDWLQFGMPGRSESTITKCTTLADTHVIPALGSRKLRELTADDVDRWLAAKAQDAEHRHPSHHPLDPPEVHYPRAGPGQGQAQRRAPLRHPAGTAGPPVQVAQLRPGRRTPGCRRGQAAARLHRRLAAHWYPDRGTAPAHLVTRPARRHSAGHHGLAVCPRRRRHQDQEVTPYPGAAATLRRRVPPSPRPPGPATHASGEQVARQ